MPYFPHDCDLNDFISWLLKLVGFGQQPEGELQQM